MSAIDRAIGGTKDLLFDYDTEVQVEKGLLAIFTIIYGICVITPFLFLIYQTFTVQSLTISFEYNFTLEHWADVLTDTTVRSILFNTFLYVLGAVIISHVLGFTFAYIITRMEIPYRNVFHTLMFLPIFVSPLILALGYSFSFVRGGFYYTFLELLPVVDGFHITNLKGMIFVGSLELVPFTYSFLSAGLRNIDPDMEDMAKLTGATELTVLREVTIPLLKPFLLSSLLLTALWSLQAVSTPVILGLPDRTYILSTYIIGLTGITTPAPFGRMAVIGVILIVLTSIMVIALNRLIGDVSEYTVITGRRSTRNIYTPTRYKIAAMSVLGGYIFLFLIVPFLQVLGVAFTEPNSIVPVWESDLSLRWFEDLYNSDTSKLAIRNSIVISVITASGTVVLTGLMAYMSLRIRSVTSKFLDFVMWFPIATPGVVLGVAYLLTAVVLDIGLYGTIWILMLAFFIRLSALGMRMNSSLLAQQSEEIDEQGEVCGATMFSRLRHIIFPNAKEGMLAIWVLLFLMFMSELSTSFFLYTSNSRVLTVTVFEFWQTGQMGPLAALAAVQVLIVSGIILFFLKGFDIEMRAV